LIEDAEVRCYSFESESEEVVIGKKRKVSDLESCKWSGKLKNRDAHYDQCQFAQMQCPHDDCIEILIRKDVLVHTVECVHRLVKCEFCDLRSKVDVIPLHLPVCDKRPGPCPNKCVDENGNLLLFIPNEIANHRTVCALEAVECAFAAMGCKVKLQRKDMVLHEKDAGAHMACICEALQADRQKIINLERNVVKDQSVIHNLQNLVSSHTKTIEAQAKVIDRLDCLVNSQIVFTVAVADLTESVISETIDIRGFKFKFQLVPNTAIDSIGYHSIFLYLMGTPIGVLGCDANVETNLLSNTALSGTKKNVGQFKFEKKGALGYSNFMKTIDLQEPCYVTNGQITITAKFTLPNPQ
jgi:hypothetical protein